MNIWKWENITRGDNQPYLTRLTIFGCGLFKIMIHWFDDSDDECLHDHPWPFVSLILKGGYMEVTPKSFQTWAAYYRSLSGDKNIPLRAKWFPAWTILYRPADWIHRIVINKDDKPVTLVVTGAKTRDWGFWTTFGWIPWFKYFKGEHCANS